MNRTKPFSALSKSFMSISSCVTDTARRKGWLKSFEEEEKKRKKKKRMYGVTSHYLLLLSMLSPQLHPSPPAASVSPPPAPTASGWSERKKRGQVRVWLLMQSTDA